MNELHKYATFSVDLVGKPMRINSMFSAGRARIFYKGINRNRSIIDGEVADRLALTIPGTPVIGTYNYETQDFEGHEENACAYGFIPLEPNMIWTTIEDGEGREREYLEVDVIIWDGRFEEAKDILTEEKSLSMELNPKTLKGTFERIGDSTYYRITNAEFAGITVLGEDVEPCFQDAKFITAFSNMVSAYALYVESIQENQEGGKNTMDNIENIVEPEVNTETVEVETEVVEEIAEVETELEVVEEEAVEEIVEEEEVVEAETEEIIEETVEEDAIDETEVVETVEEPEAVEFECKEDDKSKCEVEEEDDDKEEDEDKEEESKDYSALESELADITAKYESLKTDYEKVVEELSKYARKEKLEIINKFSTKIESEELIEKLTSEVDEKTIEEIKTELGNALVEQLSAEDETAEETSPEANFSLNINLTDNSLGNSAWDLVRRHKESK